MNIKIDYNYDNILEWLISKRPNLKSHKDLIGSNINKLKALYNS